MKAKRSILKTALLLLPLQVVFRGGEALLPIFLSAWFGASRDTDAYYLLLAIFTLAGSFVAASFTDSVMVPILSEVYSRDRKEFSRVAGALLGYAFLAGLVLSTVLILGSCLVAWLTLGDGMPVVAMMASLFGAHLVVVGVRSFFVGLLNTRHWFSAHPVASGFGMLVALLWIYFGRDRGVLVIPFGLLLGELVSLTLLVGTTLFLARIPLHPNLQRPEPVKRLIRLVMADVAGQAITRVNPVVDQAVAGLSAMVGAGTVLKYTFDVASLPTSLVQATLLPVLLSHLSDHAASGNLVAFRRTVVRAVLAVSGLMLLLALAMTALRENIVQALFLHGKMAPGAVLAMGEVLPFVLFGTIPFGILLILARAHVALQNTRIMVGMGLLNAACNAAFNFALFAVIGLRGVALSTSLMYAVVAAVFWWKLEQRLRVT